MKKIANFTQTYKTDLTYTRGTDGRDREFLFDFLTKDKVNIWLRSMLDIHTISFHNYDDEGVKIILQKVKALLPKTIGISYNAMTYAQSFLEHLYFLKNEHQITDIFWLQDDEFFTYTNTQDLEAFFNYYKNDPSLVNVAFNVGIDTIRHKLKSKGLELSCEEGEFITDTLALYRTKCIDFHHLNSHPFSSGACVCNVDLLIDILESFGDNIYTRDAYRVEGAMGEIALQKGLQRCVLNIPLAKAYNIVGMGGSLGDADNNLNELKIKFI